MSDKKEITINQVLACLHQGMNRQQIADHFGITMREVRGIFKHPKLEGKKARRVQEDSYTLVDDTEEQVSNQATTQVQEEEVHQEA